MTAKFLKFVVAPATLLSLAGVIAVALTTSYLIGRVQEIQDGIDYILDKYREHSSIAAAKSGENISLDSVVFIRLPVAAPSGPVAATRPTQGRFLELETWLTTELGGYASWEVTSQTLNGAQPGERANLRLYMVSISSEQSPDVSSEIEQKIRDLFPDFDSFLILSIPVSSPIPESLMQ